MPSRTYPLSPDQFQKFLTAIPSEGVVISDRTDAGDGSASGTVTDGAFVLGYAYVPGTLTVTGLSKKLWIPTWSTIFDLIGQHIAAGA